MSFKRRMSNVLFTSYFPCAFFLIFFIIAHFCCRSIHDLTQEFLFVHKVNLVYSLCEIIQYLHSMWKRIDGGMCDNLEQSTFLVRCTFLKWSCKHLLKVDCDQFTGTTWWLRVDINSLVTRDICTLVSQWSNYYITLCESLQGDQVWDNKINNLPS